MKEIKRLESEVLEMNDYNVSEIFKYLKSRVNLQENFNNEEKSIKEMYKYICEQARKKAVNNVAMVDGRLVYLWAVTYFTKTNEELGLKKKETNPKTDEKTKKVEKEEMHENNQLSMFQEVKN